MVQLHAIRAGAPIRPRGPYVLVELKDPVLKSGLDISAGGTAVQHAYVVAVGDGMTTQTGQRVPILDLKPGQRIEINTSIATFRNGSRTMSLVPEDFISAVYEDPLPEREPKTCPTCLQDAHVTAPLICATPSNHESA